MGLMIVRRLALLAPLMLGVSIVTFALMHLAPGDPISTQFGLNPRGIEPATLARLRADLGLDDPLPTQYVRYLRNLLRGDMGRSLASDAPVMNEILSRLPATLSLTVAAMLLAAPLSALLGALSASRRGSIWDRLCQLAALVGISMPSFWLGAVLMLLFALELGWLPSGGRGDGTLTGFSRALVLPAVTLAAGPTGLLTRVWRASLLETMSQDYVRTARAKGLSGHAILTGHMLRNALIPVLTVLSLEFAGLLGGAVVVESVFAWPGMGRLIVTAVWRRDYPVIIGATMIFSIVFVLGNLSTDILYAWIDPRVRYD